MPVRRGEENTPGLSRGKFLLLAGSIVLVDQLTKALAQAYLSPGLPLPVLPPLFHFTLVENQGIAFGLFQGGDSILFVAITASLVILTVLGFRMAPSRFGAQTAMGLILGGAVGNWIDRVRFGTVIDFLGFWIWPVFNLADTAITIGVGIFILGLFRRAS